MTDVRKIEELVQQELAEANEIHPPFASNWEAWAVIKEEVEECEEELEMLRYQQEKMWIAIRKNEECSVELKLMKYRAMSAAQEAIQIAAMCEKGLARYESEDDKGM